MPKASHANVRCGSKADIGLAPADVRFTPKSGHCRATVGCPLCATSGLMHCSKIVTSGIVEFSAAVGAG
jgi:hypothetical protein